MGEQGIRTAVEERELQSEKQERERERSKREQETEDHTGEPTRKTFPQNYLLGKREGTEFCEFF